MPGLDHLPNPQSDEPEQTSSRQIRLGWILFVLYLVFYAGFVFLNAFAPEEMERTPFAGVNIAILYGLALIVVAFVLAVLYDVLCRLMASRRPPQGPNQDQTEGGR